VLVPGAGALLAGGVVFGATKLGMELEVDAVSEPLDSPSAPHAARPNVSRLHNTTLRI
jgi:hypothetical protein